MPIHALDIAETLMNRDLELGEALIDAQHRALYRAIRSLASIDDTPGNAELISEHLNQLSILLRMHFVDEEVTMMKLCMPDELRQVHVKAHYEIVDEVTMLHLKIMGGNRPSLTELSEQIARWVIDHIMDFDLQLKSYLSPSL